MADKLAKLLVDKQNNELVETDSITVEQYLNKWMELYKILFLKSKSIEIYKNIISFWIVPNIGAYQLQKLTPDIIQKMINKMMKDDYSASTISDVLKILSGVLKQAHKNKLITNNPCLLITKPSLEKRKYGKIQ